VFGGGHLGVWAREVSRELGSNVSQPRKGNKDEKYILSVVILYFIHCDIILKLEDEKDILSVVILF